MAMNAEQAAVAKILGHAVAAWLKADQLADYPLPEPVTLVLKSRRVAAFPTGPYTTSDGSLSVTPLGEDRIEVRANAFPRSGLWNGPDVLPNNTFRGMLASLFHDLVWIHGAELAAAWDKGLVETLRWGGDVLYLVWVWASKDSWWWRREAWLAFQATQLAAPWYHRLKALAAATALAILCGGCAGAGCFSLPDGEVEDLDGAETVQGVMDAYGDGQ